MQVESDEADKLCRVLVSRYACDFVIAQNMPYRTWGKLPKGWQIEITEPVIPVLGEPHKELRGAVAVSLDTLRWLGRAR